MVKVAIIGTVGIPAKYGGFETLAQQLVENLNKDDIKYTVYCSGTAYKKNNRLKNYKNASLIYLPVDANGAWSILYDLIAILHALRKNNTLLVLGVSGLIFLPAIKLLWKKKNFVVHIDGLEWKREKWNKLAKAFLKFSEKIAVNYADITIADNLAIREYITKEYKKDSVLIEYGADHVNTPHTVVKENYAFGVCRIEPENNVHIVLEAFSQMPDKRLIMVGNWNNSQYGLALRQRFAGYSNITMLDPIYEQEKLDVLRNSCMLYMHGHSAGGTNPSLVEAMYMGLPVAAYDVVYNRYTMENKGFYFSGPEELRSVVITITPHTLQQNALDMKCIAHKRYRWAVIAKKYEQLFTKK